MGSERQACDVALLTFGGFSPLEGFMKKADYDGVVGNMRLANGVLFSLPVVLDVADASLQGKKVLLKYNGVDMAVMEAEEVWRPNPRTERLRPSIHLCRSCSRVLASTTWVARFM